jgi:hypothetical protein
LTFIGRQKQGWLDRERFPPAAPDAESETAALGRVRPRTHQGQIHRVERRAARQPRLVAVKVSAIETEAGGADDNPVAVKNLPAIGGVLRRGQRMDRHEFRARQWVSRPAGFACIAPGWQDYRPAGPPSFSTNRRIARSVFSNRWTAGVPPLAGSRQAG